MLFSDTASQLRSMKSFAVGSFDSTLDRLNDGGATAIDAFLISRVQYLKVKYKGQGDPHLVFLAAAALADPIGQIPNASKSFQFAKLLGLMAEMLIAEGRNARSLIFALDLAEQATEVLGNVDVVSVETLNAHVEYNLYRAIAQKALGKFDESLRSLSRTIDSLSNGVDATYFDLVTLHRQQVMMRQEVSGHRKLAEDAALYARSKPIAYYGTIKRVFEFAMNKQLPDAMAIFPEFKRAYSAARRKLPVLSHVSFAKNVGQFWGQHANPTQAIGALRAASAAARSLNLHGQERQVNLLINDIGQNTTNGLVTFRVDE